MQLPNTHQDFSELSPVGGSYVIVLNLTVLMASDHYFRLLQLLQAVCCRTQHQFYETEKANVWWDSWCLSSWKLNVSQPQHHWTSSTTVPPPPKKKLTRCSSLSNIFCPPSCLLRIEWERYGKTLVALFSALLTTDILNVAWSNVEQMNGELWSLITGLWLAHLMLHCFPICPNRKF